MVSEQDIADAIVAGFVPVYDEAGMVDRFEPGVEGEDMDAQQFGVLTAKLDTIIEGLRFMAKPVAKPAVKKDADEWDACPTCGKRKKAQFLECFQCKQAAEEADNVPEGDLPF